MASTAPTTLPSPSQSTVPSPPAPSQPPPSASNEQKQQQQQLASNTSPTPSKKRRNYDDGLKLLFDRIGITRGMLRSLPTDTHPTVAYGKLSPTQQNALKRIYAKCIKEVANLLFPSDGEALFHDFMEHRSEQADIISTIQEGLKACKRGSVEKRVLMSVLCASFQGSKVAHILKNHDDAVNDAEEEEDEVVEAATAAAGGEKEGDEKEKENQSINIGGNNENENNEDDTENDRPKKKAKLSGGFSKSFRRGRADWHNILVNGGVPVHKVRRNRLKNGELTIKEAIKFIFQSKHIYLLPNASRRLKINKEPKRFPYFYQRISCEKIWKDYKKECIKYGHNNIVVQQFGRSTFNRLLQIFIKSAPYSYDEKFYYLVKCNLRFLLRIIDKEIVPNDNNQLRNQIFDLQNFLQFQYPMVCLNSGTDVLHDVQFSLSSPKDDQSIHVSNCRQCLSCFQLIKNISLSCINLSNNLKLTLKDCENKLLLYMAYQHRCAYQENQLTDLFKYVRNDNPGKSIILLLNHKLNFDVNKFKDPTTMNSSQAQSVVIQNKKELSWRSSLLFYRQRNNPEQGEKEEEEQLHTLNIDHVLTNEHGSGYADEADTNENEITYSILDSILYSLKYKYPTFKNLKNVWVLGTRTNKIMTNTANLSHVIFPFIANKYNINLRGLIYPESNKAKILFDSHYLVAMKSIHKYFTLVSASPAATYSSYPKYLFKALSSLPSTCAQLISIDSNGSKLSKWNQSGNNVKGLKRFNEFYYGEITSDVVIVVCYKFPGAKPQRFVFGKYYTNKLPSNDGEDKADDDDGSSSEEEVDIYSNHANQRFNQFANSSNNSHGNQMQPTHSSSSIHHHNHISNHELNSLLNLNDQQRHLISNENSMHESRETSMNQLTAPSFTSQQLPLSTTTAVAAPTTQVVPTPSLNSVGGIEAEPSSSLITLANSNVRNDDNTTDHNKEDNVATSSSIANNDNITNRPSNASNNLNTGTNGNKGVGNTSIDEEVVIEKIYSSSETNLTILCKSDMNSKNSKKQCKIRPETAILDAAAEIEVDLDDDTSDGDEIDMIDAEGNIIPTTNQSALPQCPKCKRDFQKETSMKVHKESCNGNMDKGSLINQCKLEAFELLKKEQPNDKQTELYHNPLLDSKNKEDEIHLDEHIINEHGLKKGWARRLKLRGNMGENFIYSYIDDIKELYDMWSSDRNGKISASLLKDALHAKYPNRYDIPNEYHIQLAILQLGGVASDNDKMFSSALDEDESYRQGGGGHQGVPLTYANCLRDMVLENRKFRPRHAKATLIARLNLDENNLPNDFPPDKTIRNKISTLKTRLH